MYRIEYDKQSTSLEEICLVLLTSSWPLARREGMVWRGGSGDANGNGASAANGKRRRGEMGDA